MRFILTFLTTLIMTSISLYATDDASSITGSFKVDQSTIYTLNEKEKRHMDRLSTEYFYSPKKDNVDIYKIEIPPLFNSNLSCTGFTANFGDVWDTLKVQFTKIVRKIPLYLAQQQKQALSSCTLDTMVQIERQALSLPRNMRKRRN